MKWELSFISHHFNFSTTLPFCHYASLSCTISTILQVLEVSYIFLILFATIFHQKYSVFSSFFFFFFRPIPCFSNFPRYVMHSIHRFFHRFRVGFCCRNSQYSVFIWVLRTFLVTIKNLEFNFYRTFAFLQELQITKNNRAGNSFVSCTVLLYCFT